MRRENPKQQPWIDPRLWTKFVTLLKRGATLDQLCVAIDRGPRTVYRWMRLIHSGEGPTNPAGTLVPSTFVVGRAKSTRWLIVEGKLTTVQAESSFPLDGRRVET